MTPLAAVDLLIDAGYREGIVLLGHAEEKERGLFRSTTVARRIQGVRDRMAEHDARFLAEESIWLWEPDNGYTATKKLIKKRDGRMKALLVMNDRLTFGAYQALTEAGMRVPDDVSIVSFDNDELAAYLRPGLTTIALPHEDMGRRAVDVLLSPGDTGELLVPMPVVTRESIATLR